MLFYLNKPTESKRNSQCLASKFMQILRENTEMILYKRYDYLTNRKSTFVGVYGSKNKRRDGYKTRIGYKFRQKTTITIPGKKH